MTTGKKRALLIAACALALAGCGGGGGGAGAAPTATTGNEVPMAASQSIGGLIGWASTLAPDDGSAPLATDSFTPPVDDTAQPMQV